MVSRVQISPTFINWLLPPCIDSVIFDFLLLQKEAETGQNNPKSAQSTLSLKCDFIKLIL